MASRRRKRKGNTIQQIIGLILLLVFCALIVPMPQPVPVASGKDLSAPFPCQNRPCGCNSADQCWKQCCCFNNCEKVAWAQKHGIRLPRYVQKAAREELQLSTEKGAGQKGHKSGISSFATTFATGVFKLFLQTDITTPDSSFATSVESCKHCEYKKSAGTEAVVRPGNGQAENSRTQSQTRFVLAISALECKGLTSLWQILSLSMLPERDVHCVDPHSRCSRLYFDVADLNSCELAPPDPPPRVVGVECIPA